MQSLRLSRGVLFCIDELDKILFLFVHLFASGKIRTDSRKTSISW